MYIFFPQEELDLSAPNKTAMLSLPKEKKWQIYCSQKGSLGNDTGLSNDPEFYIEIVNRLSGLEFSHDLGMHSVENIDSCWSNLSILGNFYQF